MMHIVSTGRWSEIANVYGGIALCGGSASGNVFTSSPDILHLQAVLRFVLLANVQEI